MKIFPILVTILLVVPPLHAQNTPPHDNPQDGLAAPSLALPKHAAFNAHDTIQAIQSIFDKYNMEGTIIISDPTSGRSFGYNSSRWDSGYLPASTFKIPNTLIGLETGVIEANEIFKWNGEKRRFHEWEKDLSLQDAFQVSCVPCYQSLARSIGADRMAKYLEKINYPGMDVHPENIDRFWLEGKSRITPRQEMDFVRRLYEGRLPINDSAMKIVKEIMVNEKNATYTLSGKTGWAVRNGNNYGWFVGWIETGGRVYYLATLVEPKNQERVTDFALARKTVTLDVLRFYQIIP